MNRHFRHHFCSHFSNFLSFCYWHLQMSRHYRIYLNLTYYFLSAEISIIEKKIKNYSNYLEVNYLKHD